LKLTSAALSALLTAAQAEPPPDAAAEATPAVDPLAEAKDEYNKGSAAYQTGRYEDAVVHFERSFELSHRSDLLYNLGQAYARWYEVSDDPQHLRRARRLFKNYITSVADRPDMAESSDDAKQRIEAIDDQLEKIEDEQRRAAVVGPTEPADKPLYKKGWFWGTIVGVVVVAAAATTAGVLLSRNRRDEFEPELGTLGELGRGSPGGGISLRF
jgi:tetratricopeptide (TPR) repeat protein